MLKSKLVEEPIQISIAPKTETEAGIFIWLQSGGKMVTK